MIRMNCEVCQKPLKENMFCAGCHRYICEECAEECDDCGETFCWKCLELHQEGTPIENIDTKRCPNCLGTKLILGKNKVIDPYYADWYYCEYCGTHYRP